MREYIKAKYIPQERRIRLEVNMSTEHLDDVIRELVALRKSREPERRHTAEPGRAEFGSEMRAVYGGAEVIRPKFDGVCFAIVGTAEAAEGLPYSALR